MEIIAILTGLIILVAIGFYVSRPLVRSRQAGRASGEGDAQSLAAQRESLYTQIRELDLDHATGKVNDDDYARIRAELVVQAAAVLKEIDGVVRQPEPVTARAAVSEVPSAGDDAEALIAARRKIRATSAPKTADAEIEAAIAARRKTVAPVVSELKCPQCGRPVSVDDAFCAKCGAALQTQATP